MAGKPRRKPVSVTGRKPTGPTEPSLAALAAQMFGAQRQPVDPVGPDPVLSFPPEALPGGGAVGADPRMAFLARLLAQGGGGLLPGVHSRGLSGLMSLQ